MHEDDHQRSAHVREQRATGVPLEVLLVEDSEGDALLVVCELERAGYQPRFERVETPAQMVAALKKQDWDLVISDCSMPRFSALDALSLSQRYRRDQPFIMVSDTADEDTAVAATKAGAHDYVTRQNLDRLVPIVQRELRDAQLRREREEAEEKRRRSEANLRNIIERSADGVVIVDKDGAVCFVNPAAEALFDRGPGELLGESLGFPLVTGEKTEIEILQRTGREMTAEMRVVEMDWESEPAFLATLRDITDRKQAEQQIAHHAKWSEALYAITQAVNQSRDLRELLQKAVSKVTDVMEAPGGLVYLLDTAKQALVLGHPTDASALADGQTLAARLDQGEFERLLEWTDATVPLSSVLRETTVKSITQAFHTNGAMSCATVPLRVRSELQGILCVGCPDNVGLGTDNIELLHAMAKEMAVGIEHCKLLERTREQSITDDLTGLFNRRHFQHVLETEVYNAQRYSRTFALAMLDLDGFKAYNDTFGHASGDDVLRSLAQALQSQLRKSDACFRYGGDEFMVVLPGTDADRAEKVLDRIRSRWPELDSLHNPAPPTPLGFSAGIAQYPADAETADGLVFLADKALYHSKREGRYRSTLARDLAELASDSQRVATIEQVYALAASVDAKDPHTRGHSKKVAAAAARLGGAIGLPTSDLANLRIAAMVHDIGKTGVPESILTKPDRLTADEWRLMQMHTAEGARIASAVRDLAHLAPMILHHHEWYDGTGYPYGLKGESIPLGARIIAIADAYDTMTTPRAYRHVVSSHEALLELRRCSGTQFDPVLVEAFCQVTNNAANPPEAR